MTNLADSTRMRLELRRSQPGWPFIRVPYTVGCEAMRQWSLPGSIPQPDPVRRLTDDANATSTPFYNFYSRTKIARLLQP